MKLRIKKLNEAEERKVQDSYRGTLILAIRQSKNIDRTEVMGFIRAIPNVTTIRREKEISTSKEFYVGEFSIRIVLKYGENINNYLSSILKPSINKIDGVYVRSLRSLEKVS